MRPLVLLAFAAAGFGAVDGTLTNQTTGRPEAGAMVTLFRLDQGMQPVGSVKTDAQGKFAFDQDVSGAALLQASVDGVVYSQMLQPTAARTGIQLNVYSTARKPGEAKVTQHMILLEPLGESVQVSETYIYSNPGKTTFHDPAAGTLQFYLPASAKGIVQVNATSPGGMPTQRVAEKTNQANVWKIDFPVKPGESRIDLMYLVTSGAPFESRILFPGDGLTRLVSASGVVLKGEGIEALGQEPNTQATVYSVSRRNLKVEIEGTGSLRAAAPQSEGQAPQVEQILPRVYQGLKADAGFGAKLNSVKWILIVALATLSLGFVLLYRSGNPATPNGQSSRSRR